MSLFLSFLVLVRHFRSEQLFLSSPQGGILAGLLPSQCLCLVSGAPPLLLSTHKYSRALARVPCSSHLPGFRAACPSRRQRAGWQWDSRGNQGWAEILEGCPVLSFSQATGPHSEAGCRGKLLDLNHYQAQRTPGVRNLILLMRFLGKSLSLLFLPVKWQP